MSDNRIIGDNPVEALQALNESDARQRVPIPKYTREITQLVGLFGKKGATVSRLAGVALSLLTRREEENRQELVNAIADELKYCAERIEKLSVESEEHRIFMESELPALVLDGFRRAEQSRAKDRIQRLGRVLVHAALSGPSEGADTVEDLMKVASELSERDVAVLRLISDHDPVSRFHPSEARRLVRGTERDRWYKIDWNKGGFTAHEVESICGKLYGLGLLAPIRYARQEAPDAGLVVPLTPYELLKMGRDFLAYIRSEADPNTSSGV